MNVIVLINVLLFEPFSTGRRIFQGKDAAVDDLMYVASWVEAVQRNAKTGYIYESSHICTCSILSPSWTLSAAHCIGTSLVRKTYILYNALHTPTARGDGRRVLEAIPHPMYDFEPLVLERPPYYNKYDICLLRTRKINIARYAVLSAVDYNALIGQEVVVTGYGSTNVSSEVDMALYLKKPLQVFNGMVKRCPGKAQKYQMVICITSPCGSLAMICGGDSGGPVFHDSGIIGVNSMSENDCDFPEDLEYLHKHSLVQASSSILTPVSPVIDWISRISSNSP